MLSYWIDEDGSWYDANATYVGADGGINSITVTTGGIELEPDEDDVMLDSRPAECQQDEISELIRPCHEAIPVCAAGSSWN